jgi:hypothetical protein
MYITIIYIVLDILPTRLSIRTVIKPCTQGNFAGSNARVVRPHRSEDLRCTRGRAREPRRRRQSLNVRVIRILTIVSLL